MNTSKTSALKVKAKYGMPKNQRGAASLTDMMLWAGITLLVIGFLFVLFNYVIPVVKAYRATTIANANIQNINGAYQGQSNVGNLTTAAIAKPSIIDEKFLPGGGVILNYYGGTDTAAPATLNGVTNNTITYTMTGVPKKSCTSHVNMMADTADTISVGGTSVKSLGGQLDSNTLIAQCDGASLVTVVVQKIKQS